MKKCANAVIDHKVVVVVISLLLMVIGGIFFFAVPVNYNLTDYLPEKANSTIALNKMEKEFDQPIPNFNVMIEDVDIPEALHLKECIEAADYVRAVTWLDDLIDVTEPLDMQNQEEVETYYKDSCALFYVTVEDGKEQDAINAILESTGADCKFSGNAQEQAQAQSLAMGEGSKAIVILVPLMLVILILTTTSWIEPFLYLLAIGVAVLVNLGSNIFLGDVSFVTLAVAPILQMAVSLDYAIFLSHSFNEYRQEMDVREAMVMAIQDSGKSISASMMTTLFGFLALLFMNFKIGPDMGISLVKGVFLSFISVLIFLPALMLCCRKWIDKTAHRRIIPEFRSIGRGIMKIKVPVLILLVLIIIPSVLAQSKNEFFYGTESVVSSEDADLIEEKFGTINTIVLMVPRGDSTKETLLCERLQDTPHITSVVSYASMVSNKIPEQYLSTEITSQFYSDKFARIILYTDTENEGKEAFELVENVRTMAREYYESDVYTCGRSANLYDMKIYVESDNKKVNLITVISIYLILMLTFQNWLLPIPLILTIKCSIWINMAIPYFMGQSLCYIGYLVVSTVQMGATVDYAILLTDNYLKERSEKNKKQAIIGAMGETFGSILVSATILACAGACLGVISSNMIVSSLGNMVGKGAILSLILVMLLLPSLLLLLDPLISKTSLPIGLHRKREGTGYAEEKN